MQAVPAESRTQPKNRSVNFITGPRPQVIEPGRGESYWSVGDLVTFTVGADATGGAFWVAETTCQPGGGPPPHVHSREDEIFYVLDGELQFTAEDRVYIAGPGDAFFLPRESCHTFHNASNREAKMIVMGTPSGFENFMREFGLPLKKFPRPPSISPRPEDMTRLTEAAARYGMQLRLDHKPSCAPIAPPRGHRTVPVMGMRIELKLTVADTNGALSLVTINAPRGTGAPIHAHRAMEELFYVERGTFQFVIGERKLTASAGTTVFVPRGIMHGFTSVGDEEGRLMDVHLPGGFEDFFIEVSESPAELSPTQIAGLFDKHGMDMPR